MVRCCVVNFACTPSDIARHPSLDLHARQLGVAALVPDLPIGIEEIHQDSSRPVLPRQVAVCPSPLDLGDLSAFVDLGHGPLGQLDRLCLALVNGVVRQSSDDLWPGSA